MREDMSHDSTWNANTVCEYSRRWQAQLEEDGLKRAQTLSSKLA